MCLTIEASPPPRRWGSLFRHPLKLGCAVTRFGQLDAVEVRERPIPALPSGGPERLPSVTLTLTITMSTKPARSPEDEVCVEESVAKAAVDHPAASSPSVGEIPAKTSPAACMAHSGVQKHEQARSPS